MYTSVKKEGAGFIYRVTDEALIAETMVWPNHLLLFHNNSCKSDTV